MNRERAAAGTALGFPKRRRLIRAAEFREVFRRSCRISAGPLTLMARPNRLDGARLGLAISKKHLKTAVGRNRVKRQIRESFRLHNGGLGGLDIVVVGRGGLERADLRALRADLDRSWRTVARRCRDS